ncbi:MAG: sigma-70 family RNA polymerase sigma factor [Deltaproteobacteria bacterium]|nr:sigma-70 family RNA polymerase sigma factor [Deltaproteobacteria bacterium]
MIPFGVARDAELLVAWREGNHRAGEELFSRYFEPISRFFTNKVGSDHDDMIQETFEACVRGRDRLRDDTSFRAYLFSVAFNVLKGHFRRKRAHARIDDLGSISVHDISPGPSTLVGAVEQEQLVLDALRRIPMDFQVVLEMRYWEEMSSVEIGAALGIPAPTVRSRLSRGREALERAIAQLPARSQIRDSTVSELGAWISRIRASMSLASGSSSAEP